ncbi:MAG TPA: class I SAM-dependent methyltransferase [Terracidiphilus sp.]|nr:class I SAM-dependent methyltransferase [Terracidiphilus sp.]
MNTTLNSQAVIFETIRPARNTPPNSAPNFDSLARIYRWMELVTFGPFLARCRTAFLPNMAQARRALVIGDGDGRFTAELLGANSQIQVDTVDASPEMLAALLRRTGPNARRVSLHCADARSWKTGNAQYDLVATHFFLDCLTTDECRALAVRLRNSLSPAALWIVSEFAIPEGWFGKLVARPLVWLLYRAFGLLTGLRIRSLPDHHAALRNSGIILTQRRTRLGGLLVSEAWRPEA